jgi:glycosyltransferase involved in cell wall biosynthesis
MITILFIYKNKDLKRVKNALVSLQNQTLDSFEIIFVDFGSDVIYNKGLKGLLKDFPKVFYYYTFTKKQPWSRSKAINIGLKFTKTPYVFVADIDMVFSPVFVEKLVVLCKPNHSFYFKVGFLDKKITDFFQPFDTIPIASLSKQGAQGLSLFCLESLKKINGFDEFYHLWGAEDADVHVRLKNAGYSSSFYDSEILMLHQWHPSYRSSERKKITSDIQLSGIVQLNHQHLKTAIFEKRTKVNDDNWGVVITKDEYSVIKYPTNKYYINNTKPEIDHFLSYNIKQKDTFIKEYCFRLAPNYGSLKQSVKKILGKKTPQYYTLKEINDFLLLYLISTPSIHNYSYSVAGDLKSISLIF